MGLGELTLHKVRQLQKFDTFYNGMYRFLQYEHLPKDKLLARMIKSNKVCYDTFLTSNLHQIKNSLNYAFIRLHIIIHVRIKTILM